MHFSVISEETIGDPDETYKYFNEMRDVCSNIIDKHASQ